MKRNVGQYDRLFRFILGIVLVYIGLVTMGGLQGKIIGIIVAATAILPFYMALTASCFVFRWFKVHSLSKKELEKQNKPKITD